MSIQPLTWNHDHGMHPDTAASQAAHRQPVGANQVVRSRLWDATCWDGLWHHLGPTLQSGSVCSGCEAGAKIGHWMVLQAVPGPAKSGDGNQGPSRVQLTRNIHTEETGSGPGWEVQSPGNGQVQIELQMLLRQKSRVRSEIKSSSSGTNGRNLLLTTLCSWLSDWRLHQKLAMRPGSQSLERGREDRGCTQGPDKMCNLSLGGSCM